MVSDLNKNRVSEKISSFLELLIYLIAFSLPFKLPVPVLIVITLLVRVILSALENDYHLHRVNYFFLMVTLCLLPLFYIPFTSNFQEGLTSLELKLSYLALPMIFFFSNLKISFFKVFRYFFWGNVLAVLLCFIRAGLRNNEMGFEAFYYENFSWFMHPSYFAMYVNLSIFSLFYFYFAYRKFTQLEFYLGLFILAVTPTFLASKMGLLSLVIAFPVFLLSILWKKKRKLALFILTITFLFSFVVVLFVPSVSDRFQNLSSTLSNPEKIDKSTLESNAVRLLVWNSAAEVWTENFFMGTSPGDANNALYKKYEEKNYSGALAHHLNAHNQFLQTAIGLGLLGLLHLLFLFLFPLLDDEVRSPLFFGFTALLFFNFLVESMLQTQAGVTFHAFFLSLFLCGKTRLGNTVSNS